MRRQRGERSAIGWSAVALVAGRTAPGANRAKWHFHRRSVLDQHGCMPDTTSGLHTSWHHSQRRRGTNLLGLAGLALMVMAVVKELRKPSAERSWHGEVLGFVPYDLRPPTVSRLRASVWQPDSERWLLPRSLGVGWSPNMARIAAVFRKR